MEVLIRLSRANLLEPTFVIAPLKCIRSCRGDRHIWSIQRKIRVLQVQRVEGLDNQTSRGQKAPCLSFCRVVVLTSHVTLCVRIESTVIA